jgi:hypothetical protein
MDDDLAEFYVHTAIVEAYLGSGADGDVYGAPATIPGYWEGGSKLIVNADGEQLLAQGVFRTAPEHAAAFPILSRVTVEGITGRVQRLATFTSGALDLPDHIEVYPV